MPDSDVLTSNPQDDIAQALSSLGNDSGASTQPAGSSLSEADIPVWKTEPVSDNGMGSSVAPIQPTPDPIPYPEKPLVPPKPGDVAAQTDEPEDITIPPPENKKEKKKTGKIFLLVGILLLILTLPVVMYFVTQPEKWADLRGRAAAEKKYVCVANELGCLEYGATAHTVTTGCSSTCSGSTPICCEFTTVSDEGTPTPSSYTTDCQYPSWCTELQGSQVALTNCGGSCEESKICCRYPQSAATGNNCGNANCNLSSEYCCETGCVSKNDSKGQARDKDTACSAGGGTVGTGAGGSGFTYGCYPSVNHCVELLGVSVAISNCSPACSGSNTICCRIPQSTTASSPTNTPTHTPTRTPTPTQAAGTPTPTVPSFYTPTPTPTQAAGTTPTPTMVPRQCNEYCENNDQCTTGLSCVSTSGATFCRKGACPEEYSCTCPNATSTPTSTLTPTQYVYADSTSTPTPTDIVYADDGIEDTTTTDTTTYDGGSSQLASEVPVSGGLDILGASVAFGSIILVLIGILL